MIKERLKKKLKEKFQIDGFGKNIFGDVTFSLSKSDPNYRKDVKRYVAVETLEDGGNIVITAEWNKIQPANIEEIEDNLIDIVNSKGIDDVKTITKEIRDNAKKLPKKKMKLESVLIEAEQDEMIRKLKIKLPGITKIVKYKNGWEVGFTYKGIRFVAEGDGLITNFRGFYGQSDTRKTPAERKALYKIDIEVKDIIKTLNRAEVIEKTKEIRKTAIKLPKKTLKLEDTINEMTINELVGIVKRKVPSATNIKISYPKMLKLFFEYKKFTFSLEYGKTTNSFLIMYDDNHKEIINKGGYSRAREIEDELHEIFNSVDVEDAKEKIKKIKSTATKLPKKTMKLESVLSEARKKDYVINLIKKKIPNVIETRLRHRELYQNGEFTAFIEIDLKNGKELGIHYTKFSDGNEEVNVKEILNDGKHTYEKKTPLAKKIDLLFLPGIKEVDIITKEIKNKSTKLPKKTLKLKEWVNG